MLNRISHGNMEIVITGDNVGLEDLTRFFHPLFNIKNENDSIDVEEILCTVKLTYCTNEQFHSLSSKYQVSSQNKIVLYSSKRIEHHIEAFQIEPINEHNPILYSNDFIVSSIPALNQIEIYYGENCNINQLVRVIVRDLFYRRWEQKGALMLHASAVCQKGHAYLFVGPKGSGKTNTQLRYVANGWSFMSFDRVIVFPYVNNELQCLGWPTYFNLDLETIDRFRKILPDADRYFSIRPHEDHKISLVADDVAHLAFLKQGELKQIFFPLHNFSHNKFDREQAIQMVINEVFPHVGWSWHGFFTESSLNYEKSLKKFHSILKEKYSYVDQTLCKGSENINAHY